MRENRIVHERRLSLALTGAAHASDVANPEAVTDWSGFYAGLNAGIGMNDADLSMSTGPSGGFVPGDTYFQPSSVPAVNALGDMSDSSTDFTGGLQAGYNFQQDGFLVGVEADINYLGMDASSQGSAEYPCCLGNIFTISQEAGVDWLGTARVRLGWAAGEFLIYGTGGLAFGNVKYQGSFSDLGGASESASSSSFETGWAAGGGVEWMIQQSMTLRLEYLHYDLGTVSDDGGPFTALGAFPNTHIDHKANVDGDIIRVGLNLLLN